MGREVIQVAMWLADYLTETRHLLPEELQLLFALSILVLSSPSQGSKFNILCLHAPQLVE